MAAGGQILPCCYIKDQFNWSWNYDEESGSKSSYDTIQSIVKLMCFSRFEHSNSYPQCVLLAKKWLFLIL